MASNGARRRAKRTKRKPPPRPRVPTRGARLLKVFLKERGLSLSAFGTRLGISRGQVGMYTSGRSKPSLDLAVLVEKLTEGAVPCDAWVDEAAAAA